MVVVSQHISNIKTLRKITFNVIFCLVILFPSIGNLNGQITTNEIDGSDRYGRSVSALFLTIAPDARSAGSI